MRLFIAMELSDKAKSRVWHLRQELERLSGSGRFTAQNNLHITLHFIGETKDAAGVVAAMKESVRGIRPFELRLGEYGFFERNNSKTAYISVNGDIKELNLLYESLQSAMGDHGFNREHRRYTPHITLGRNVEHDETVTNHMKALSKAEPITFLIKALVLFESRKGANGMVYTPVHVEKF